MNKVKSMQIRDLFASDVTRDIPPVVYFHEQSQEKLAAEVSEYIITGGWPKDHPNHRRVPDGIHEQYVRLLKAISRELAKKDGPELPTVWISGFYGSGKSSFAKLLGLALDGAELPDGTSLAQAWLDRDVSLQANELRDAWRELRENIDPIAVVFDIGGSARSDEHVHSAIVRQVQQRLGYCRTEPLVADFELKLERDGDWQRFLIVAEQVLHKPWDAVKDRSLAEEDFSLVMHELYPDRYTDPMAWFTSRGGTHSRSESPEEAVKAIRDMIAFRRPGSTLFIVVDEVSQYVLSVPGRGDRLRAFASALGATLRGKAWLLALGQQKLDEDADESFLIWAKDRFPPRLRIHLASTNIRDVVHRRLLHKKSDAEPLLRELFAQHRPDLELYAYGCDSVTPEEFIEIYPMLPGHIDLLLQITSALRTRSSRAQGDDQAIRGLLQLLGELFRDQHLADLPVGSLITLEQIYEVQYSALESDVQNSMTRILSQCNDDASVDLVRVAKAVALLELIQEHQPTTADLVAKSLYDRIDRGNHLPRITASLEELRRRNLLNYSEKTGYKLQSSSGEEWQRERKELPAPRELRSDLIQEALKHLLVVPDRPKLQTRAFPWAGSYSDGRRHDDTRLQDPRDEASMHVDFRFLPIEERKDTIWIPRSNEQALRHRLIWIAGDTNAVEQLASDLVRSRRMVEKYRSRRESLSSARKMLLQEEEIRVEDMERDIRQAIAQAWMAGKMYFQNREIDPHEHGSTFNAALLAAAIRILPDLYPHFIDVQILPAELMQLLETDLNGPSPKFLSDQLGILEVDNGRYVPTCGGVVPRRILEKIEAEDGQSGAAMLTLFGGPPYGYTINVVRACIAGLLRGQKVRIQSEDNTEITSHRDAGIRDIFEKDRPFKQATVFPVGDDNIGYQARARIAKFFRDRLNHHVEREDAAIADAVSDLFPRQAEKLRAVLTNLNRLPDSPDTPPALERLGEVLEQCVRTCRQTAPTVKLVKKHLDALNDGVQLLGIYFAELTDDIVKEVRQVAAVRDHQAAQLQHAHALTAEDEAALHAIVEQLQRPTPWRDMHGLTAAVETLKKSYSLIRQNLLQWQEQQAEQARSRIRGREGFSTLSADQAHTVIGPIADCITDTTPDAIAPPLETLKDPFRLALSQAEDEANERLDQILCEEDDQIIAPIDLHLHNREILDEEDVEQLLDEIRERLLEQLRNGARVRLL